MAVRVVGDIWDDLKSGGESVVDAATSAVESVPIYGPLKDAWEGPLRDFARTTSGKIVLRAITTLWYGPVAWTIGPQLGAVVFAFPGIVRGERFDEAWMLEFRWRAETTAEILGPGVLEMFGAQLKEALTTLGEEIGVGNLVAEAAAELAARLGIREDIAQFAIDLWNRSGPTPRDAFSLLTGKRVRSAYAAQTIVRAAATAAPTAVSTLMVRPLDWARDPIDKSRRAAGRSAPAAPQPTPTRVALSPPEAPRPSKYKTFGDVLLVVVIAAAGVALYKFYAPKRGT